MRGLRAWRRLVPLLGAASGSTKPVVHLRKRARLLHSLGLDASLGTLIFVLVVGLLLKSLISLFVMRKVGYANAEVANLMRVRLIRQMLGARWSYLLEHPTGRIANAFSGEVGRSQQAYQLAAQFVAEAVETVVMLLLGAAGVLEAGRWHRSRSGSPPVPPCISWSPAPSARAALRPS